MRKPMRPVLVVALALLARSASGAPVDGTLDPEYGSPRGVLCTHDGRGALNQR